MLYAPKFARLSREAARKDHDVAALDAAVPTTLRLKDGVYLAPFKAPLPGIEALPDGYDPEGRTRFNVTDKARFLRDLAELIETDGIEKVGNACIGGIDLEWRGGRFDAYKKGGKKLSASDKVSWIVSNKPDIATSMIGQPRDAWVAWYDQNVSTSE